jgi:Porin PorA
LQDRAVPLVYEEQLAGRFSVEPKTGSLVSVARDRSVVAVRPDPRALGPLLTILKRHGDLPAVASALPELQAATATAQPVFALDYHQTQASIEDIRDTVGSTVLMVDVAKLWLPLGLLIVGLGLVAAGLWRRRSAAEPTR